MKKLLFAALLLTSSSAIATEYPLHPGEKLDLPLEGGNTLSITLNSIQNSDHGLGCEVNVQKLKFTGATLYSVTMVADKERSDPTLGWTANAIDENTCHINVRSEAKSY